MSLSDKLKDAVTEASSKTCKVGTLLETLPPKDVDVLARILSVPESDPARVPNSQIGKILREEGHDVSNSSVDRHRRGDCGCKKF